TDLKGFGERQVRVDCDVLQADGGTRTASVTGAYVALHLAFRHLVDEKMIENLPLLDQVAAVSCGIYKENVVVDLDYAEDSKADTDANFVMTSRGGLVEIQATAEGTPFNRDELGHMMDGAEKATAELFKLQRAAVGLS
ncbi:MAG: ribonuclease PH, partial [Alphaproteobacteria bacterium]